MPIAPDVVLGTDVKIFHPTLVNLYGCRIGDDTKIGTFVEIQKNAVIGRRCKISSHTFVCEGVTIEDDVFVGHGVMFINDRYPRATADGRLQTEADWQVVPTRIRQRSVARQRRRHSVRRHHRRERDDRRRRRGHARCGRGRNGGRGAGASPRLADAIVNRGARSAA